MVFGNPGDEAKGLGDYVGDSGSILSLQPWIFRKGSCQVDGENMTENVELLGMDGFAIDNDTAGVQLLSPWNVRLGCGFGKWKSSIKSRRSRYSILPMDSQTRLIPQLYGDNFEIQEFVFSLISPPTLPPRRPFFVTDGSHVISKSSYEQMDSLSGNEPSKKKSGVTAEGAMVGFSGLPEPRKVKRKSPLICRETKDASNQKQMLSGLLGTFDGLRLFCMGISLGSALAMMTRKKEVERLGEMLSHSEDLVQDLQDKLELKDALTVKEIISNSSEIQDVTMTHPSSSNNTIKQSEFSIIEAELQAELERLELSMNVSTLEEKLSAFHEMDEDQIAEVIQGELCADKLNHWEDDPDDSHCNSRGMSTNRTPRPNYSVSPAELSLRLHELKQSRLEERIRELETTLAHSQRHIHFMESEVMESANTSSDLGSSNQESPTVVEQATLGVQPLRINLSEDSLDAYEAYDEFIRMSEVEEKHLSPCQTSRKMPGDDVCGDNSELPWALDGYALGSPTSECHLQEKAGLPKSTMEWDSELYRPEVADGEDDVDDEGRSLIQQIVEKTRSGSPFVLNVQKMLLSMDK